MTELARAMAEGTIGGCLWIYSNYHCNLSCRYCLTESSPSSERRLLGTDRMLELARSAKELGFTSLGVGGGEPFILKEMPEVLAQMAEYLPVLVLTNGTLFKDELLPRLRPLAELPVTLQVSLDSAAPERNDRFRGDGNFDTVVAAVRRLRALDIDVRIATTGADQDDDAREALRRLCDELDVSDDKHVERPVVRRGRAIDIDLGVKPTTDNLQPELTITADGAFWSPFAPTVHNGKLDTDLLVSRTILPLSRPTQDLLGIAAGRPAGADAHIGIR